MNKHLTEGELRASLDLELDQEQLHHLEHCPACQAQKQQMQAQQESIATRLAFLSNDGTEAVPPARKAWQRFRHSSQPNKEYSMFKRLFAFPVARAAAALLVVLALVLTFPSTRALASQLLNLFRVQKVAVLPIDTSGMEKMTGNEALGRQMGNLLSESTEVIQEPGEPVEVANADAAIQEAGFAVRLPAGQSANKIIVSSPTAFRMTINRSKAQGLLDEAGRGDLVLPQSVDGAKIAVEIPSSVNATYGTCPEWKETDDENGHGENDFYNAKYADCLVFLQIPSPTVNAPADLDIAPLVQIALEFSGMDRAEAEKLVQSVDWTSTLVVPLPRGMATHKEISVDGVTGTLIQQDSEYASEFVLIWVKNGVVYSITGHSADPSRALELLKTLP